MNKGGSLKNMIIPALITTLLTGAGIFVENSSKHTTTSDVRKLIERESPYNKDKKSIETHLNYIIKTLDEIKKQISYVSDK